MGSDIETDMNPVQTAIMNNRFVAIVEEASATLHRTAHTTFVKLIQDYQCALATPEGDLFAYPSQSGVNSFIGTPLQATLALIDFDQLAPGDVFVTNDPFSTQGLVTHLMDVTMIRPIFFEGALMGFAWAFVHASDIGGAVPGSISPAFSEVFQEGLRMRLTRIYQAGVLNETVKNIFLDNSRLPDEIWGDFKAMLTALSSMERRLGELCARYGAATVRAGQHAVLAFAEAKARAVFATIPDGSYSFTDYIEGADADQLIHIALTLRVAGSDVWLDFNGTDPQVPVAYNFVCGERPHPYLLQALIYFVLSAAPDTPRNAGILRPVHVVAPRGSIINAEFPAAGGSRVASSTRTYDAILACLNQALPEPIAAAGSGMVGIIVVSAQDPATGRKKVSVYNPICGGSGARRARDGIDGVDTRFGSLKTVPAEINEIETVMRVRRYGLLPDSQAAGEWQGGAAVVMELENTGLDTMMTVRGMNRFLLRPWGLDGGAPGRLGEVTVDPDTPAARSIGKITVLHLKRGEVVRLVTPAGGGIGDPLRRDPARIARDLAAGLVSPERASAAYGVVLGADGNIDATATVAERARRATLRGPDAAAAVTVGPERAAIDALWPPAVRSALARRVLAEPGGRRQLLLSEVLARARACGVTLDLEALDALLAATIHDIWGRYETGPAAARAA